MKLKFSKKVSILSFAVLAIVLMIFMVYSLVLVPLREGSSPSSDKTSEEPNSPLTPGEIAQDKIKSPEGISTIATSTIADSEHEAINGSAIVGNGQWIYFSSAYFNSPLGLYRARPQGETLVRNIYPSSVTSISIMNNRLYCSDYGRTIFSLAMDGTDTRILLDYSDNPQYTSSQIYCYRSRVYLVKDFQTLLSMNEQGEDLQEHLTLSSTNLNIIAIEDDMVYYTFTEPANEGAVGPIKVSSYDLKTKIQGEAFTLDENIFSIKKQGDYLYYSQFQSQGTVYEQNIIIKSFNLLTEQKETLISYSNENLGAFSSFIIIGDKLYYSKDMGIYEYSLLDKSSRLIESFDTFKYAENIYRIELYEVQNSIYATISYSETIDTSTTFFTALLIIKPLEQYDKSYVYLTRDSV